MRRIENFYDNNFGIARLIAAFLVLFTHGFELVADLSDEPVYTCTNGKLRCSTIGLYIFFFTSGYLVTKSFIETPNVGEFIWKRFLRIIPALLFIVLLSVLLIGPIFTLLPLNIYFTQADTYRYLFTSSGLYIRHILPGVFTGSQHYDHGINGSLWSISLEIKLYISLIFFGYFIKKGIKNIITLVVIAAIILDIIVLLNLFDLQRYLNPLHFNLLVIFWIGSLSSINYKKIFLSSRILFVAGISWLICLYYFEPLRIFLEIPFFCYLTLFCCYSGKSISLKADLSYGIYLYAFLITQIFVELLGKIYPLFLIIMVTAVVIIFSLASWTFIEKKSLSLKKYYLKLFSNRLDYK